MYPAVIGMGHMHEGELKLGHQGSPKCARPVVGASHNAHAHTHARTSARTHKHTRLRAHIRSLARTQPIQQNSNISTTYSLCSAAHMICLILHFKVKIRTTVESRSFLKTLHRDTAVNCSGTRPRGNMSATLFPDTQLSQTNK